MLLCCYYSNGMPLKGETLGQLSLPRMSRSQKHELL